jgi:hypothetical protein
MSSDKQTPHSFWPSEAEQFGIPKAVLIFDIRHWLTQHKNNAQKVHLRDGFVWMFNSATAFSIRYPYMSLSTISRHLKELEIDGIIKSSGDFNRAGYDRTKWYTIPSEFELNPPQVASNKISQNEKSISQNDKSISQNDKSISQNEKLNSQNERPIPNTNSYTYTDTEDNNSNNAGEEIHPVLARAKQADQQTSRQLQTSDTHLAMTDAWMPSELTIQRISSLAIPVEFINQQIPNFRVYWISENRPPKSNTWDAAFLGNVQRNWARQQNQQGANANAANQQQRSTSRRYQQPGQFSIDHDDLSWFHEMQSEQSPFDAPADGAGCQSSELRPASDHNDFPEMARALPNAAGSEFGQAGLDANFGGAGCDE